MERCVRFEHGMSLIMLDIDNFKQFNDRYGHPKGDTVLKAVSTIIRQNLREVDVAARYGGEEFVIMLPETDIAGAAAVAERIRASMSQYSHISGDQGERVAQTISLGVASYPTNASSAAGLVEAADQAMYRAKRAGKNQVVVAS
jgi:diguanylate cyclase (GGDEF)-like protein